MGKTIFRIVFFVFAAFPLQKLFAQSGIGIGTSNPNPNAALDIQSAANDKGILIPRLTSAERLAMNGSLSANENGLLVFDSDLKTFYYWNGSIWTSMSVVQDLQLIGNILSITNNGSATDIDLAPFSGTNTDNQNLGSSSSGNNRTISITGGTPTTFNVADNDNNSNNELQTIAKAGATVTLSNSGGAFSVNDADSNPANELQNLSSTSSGTNRTIAINGGTNATINVADNDNNSSNELQTVSKVAATVTLSNGGGAFSVNDGDSNPTNEIQNLSSTSSGTNRTIAINGGTSATINVADNDNSTTNELQTLSKVGSAVTLSNGGGGFTDAVNDGDADPENELQTLNVAGSTLSISGGNSVTLPSSGTTKEAFKAFKKGNSSLVKGTWPIIFDSPIYDISGNYDPGAGVYKVPFNGIYHINGMVTIGQSFPDVVDLVVLVNGVPVYRNRTYPDVEAMEGQVGYPFSFDQLLSVGDALELQIVIPGVTRTILGGDALTFMSGRLAIEL